MSWRDGYRDASFRGAAFFVEDASSTHGRRQAVHEHAQRDVPYTEDLGRKAREFTVTGYLIGADYQAARDDLIEACETAGPGLLIHPYRGEMNVNCRGLSVSESSSEGGFCRVSLTFIEAGAELFPTSEVNSVSAISSAADAVKAASRASFVERFVTGGFPGYVLGAAESCLTSVADFIASPGQSILGEFETAAELYYDARDIAATAFDLVQRPVAMADRLLGTISSIRGAFGVSSFGVLSGLISRFRGASSVSNTLATPSRRQVLANQNATDDLVRQTAIAEASREAIVRLSNPTATAGDSRAVFGPYPSVQDVIAVRDQLTDAIDTELESPRTSDDVYNSMAALRSEIVRAMPLAAANLPKLMEYTPAATLPALVVSYQLYGDAGRADEITARNRSRHPGFLTGGEALEVLSDG